MAKSLAYVNGEYVELEEAKIEALDRGFIYGDGLYEVIAVYGGELYQLDEHLERYWNGAEEIMFENHPTPDELKKICRELVEKSEIDEGIVYLEVTRGAAPRAHSFPSSPTPGVFLFAKSASRPDADKKNNGVKTIFVPDERWDRCNVKSVNLLPNCMYKEKAKREGAFEAVQVRRIGVTEGTSTNIFGVKDGVIYTAPESNKILSGITRSTIIELAEEQGIEVVEKFMTPEEFYNCDEVFISSTTIKLLPVKQIDQVTYPVSEYRVTFLLQEELDKHILENKGTQ